MLVIFICFWQCYYTTYLIIVRGKQAKVCVRGGIFSHFFLLCKLVVWILGFSSIWLMPNTCALMSANISPVYRFTLSWKPRNISLRTWTILPFNHTPTSTTISHHANKQQPSMAFRTPCVCVRESQTQMLQQVMKSCAFIRQYNRIPQSRKPLLP